ncbi:MAG TPA: response regulator transcription factor [Bacteroidia bacterium]|nr:response regulator transcription factor [Bacteroidia bacterium]
MRVLIADDHAIVRKGLAHLIHEEFSDTEIIEASNGTEVLEKVKNGIYDAILIDISMPGRNGLEILKQIRDFGIKAPVLVISMHPEDQYAVRVLKAGASGFLNKDTATEELITAIHKVLSGKKYVSASLAEKMAEGYDTSVSKPINELLSDREMQVLQLIASGKTVGAIAEEISLSVNTISTYRTRILEKLNLANNAELMRCAIDNGLV